MWRYVLTELGAGIECTNCEHKLKAMTVVMGEHDLNVCPFCSSTMEPIEQELLDRMKEEVQTRW
jgi:DNA-directed RNA polymerase subunit RPC12/RpoP